LLSGISRSLKSQFCQVDLMHTIRNKGFLEAFSGRGGFPAVIAGREWQVFESQHGRLEFTLSAIAVLG